MSEKNSFQYALGQDVKLTQSEETGTVIGRAEYLDQSPAYEVLYRAGDGRQVKAWWNASELQAA